MKTDTPNWRRVAIFSTICIVIIVAALAAPNGEAGKGNLWVALAMGSLAAIGSLVALKWVGPWMRDDDRPQ